MSYLAKLLIVYKERQRLEALEGFVFADTYFRLKELADLLITPGCTGQEPPKGFGYRIRF